MESKPIIMLVNVKDIAKLNKSKIFYLGKLKPIWELPQIEMMNAPKSCYWVIENYSGQPCIYVCASSQLGFEEACLFEQGHAQYELVGEDNKSIAHEKGEQISGILRYSDISMDGIREVFMLVVEKIFRSNSYYPPEFKVWSDPKDNLDPLNISTVIRWEVKVPSRKGNKDD